jgi:hypothetical protein
VIQPRRRWPALPAPNALRTASPFVVLWRTFFMQFFTNETVSSDVQMRQTMIWVVAFLLVPGVLLLVEVFFDYQGIVLRALRFQQFDVLDDTLEWEHSSSSPTRW